MMNPPTRARNPIDDLRSREGVLCAAMNLPEGNENCFWEYIITYKIDYYAQYALFRCSP